MTFLMYKIRRYTSAAQHLLLLYYIEHLYLYVRNLIITS